MPVLASRFSIARVLHEWMSLLALSFGIMLVLLVLSSEKINFYENVQILKIEATILPHDRPYIFLIITESTL